MFECEFPCSEAHTGETKPGPMGKPQGPSTRATLALARSRSLGMIEEKGQVTPD